MTRSIYREEHNIFRSTFRKYVQKEVVPYLDEWEEREEIPRSAWRRLGELGFLCPWVDEKYGGSGAGFEYSVIITEELVRAGAYGWPVGHHSDIIAPYIDTYGTEEQKARWLPGCTSGNIILAIAMTEPSSGSDLQVIQTEAIKKGDSYVINGIRVAEELSRHTLGEDVSVYVYRELDLSLIEKLQGASKVVLVDALKSGKPPGTVSKYSIASRDGPPVQLPSLHGLRLSDLFALANQAGLLNSPVTVVGVEPKDCRPGKQMSRELVAALPKAVDEVAIELKASVMRSGRKNWAR